MANGLDANVPQVFFLANRVAYLGKTKGKCFTRNRSRAEARDQNGFIRRSLKCH